MAVLAGSLVRKGDFIEETLGIAERDDILKNGFSVERVSTGSAGSGRHSVDSSSLNTLKSGWR